MAFLTKFFLKILATIALILPFLFANEANAAAFLAEFCNLTNIVTGNAGKAIAAFGVVSVGVGFFTGRVSWGLLVGVTTGVGLMFGAPTIVSAISGNETYFCSEGETYVSSCSNGVCYSCPIGYGGPNCESCAIGFKGANCDICDTGYNGDKCQNCDEPTYTRSNGICQLSQCTSISSRGISANILVDLGNGVLNCEGNFQGTASYSCSNGIFSTTSNACSCPQKYEQNNCTTCATGYNLPDCNSCSTDYTWTSSSCQPDCFTNGISGIPNSTRAIPPNGTLGCTVSGYTGTIDYTCTNGNFSTNDTCQIIDSCRSIDEIYQNEPASTITLTAPAGKVWRDVYYASYGTPNSCVTSSCHIDATSVVRSACIGQSTCSIIAANSTFGGDPCSGIPKRLQVKMTY